MTQYAQGKETIRTEEGETATATFTEIFQLNPATGEGKGITIAVIHTNSTGRLACTIEWYDSSRNRRYSTK